MKSTITTLDKTHIKLSVSADAVDLDQYKNAVLKERAKDVKISGFREGKAPLNLVEKQLNPNVLQSEVIEFAVNSLYPVAVRENKLRPATKPSIAINKFVPYTLIEFEATVGVISDVKLADYKKVRKSLPEVKITADEVKEVLESLRVRSAVKTDVARASKLGDQVWIDFTGTDKSGKKIDGADGSNYPLLLGSNTFIPGFEDNLVGVKKGDEKEFTLTFPKDYQLKLLANKKVNFKVKVNNVQEVKKPEIDDDFAKTVAPVKNVVELKEDIKKQLLIEKKNKAHQEYESELVQEISKKSKLSIPDELVDEQVEKMLSQQKQSILYRGQTWEEFLKSEGKDEKQFIEDIVKPSAKERLQASIVLAEIADKEQLFITPEELEIRIQALKSQYQDEQMQAELNKPENRSEIASRMLSEKVLAKLAEYATTKN